MEKLSHKKDMKKKEVRIMENEGLIYKFSGSNLIKGDPDMLHHFQMEDFVAHLKQEVI